MSTSAERQRKRRERLRKAGIVDVTVTVPRDRTDALRSFARNLTSTTPAIVEPYRLLETLSALKSIRAPLEQSGVHHAGVFGSTATGNYQPDSDVDILIDIDTDQVGDVLNYVKLIELITNTVQIRFPDTGVDVVDQKTLKPNMREQAERDAVYAF